MLKIHVPFKLGSYTIICLTQHKDWIRWGLNVNGSKWNWDYFYKKKKVPQWWNYWNNQAYRQQYFIQSPNFYLVYPNGYFHDFSNYFYFYYLILHKLHIIQTIIRPKNWNLWFTNKQNSSWESNINFDTKVRKFCIKYEIKVKNFIIEHQDG